ncbi:MAG: carboxypeptidase-like regulatory domain-containing protein [Bacteroidales bacterium]|nr:carboxypeptidase-like regulatory domain-containing protein [Bacteroidales bacterium]MCF8454937.1 carboxypeptidase-like regulatory domain-containing protein [Bacteroidales bacterium]
MRIQNRWLYIVLLNLIANIVFGQHVFNGEIIDEETGEKLPFAALSKVGANIGTVSNADGFFSFKSPECLVDIEVTYLGYQNKTIRFNCQNDHSPIQIRLRPSSIVIGDVSVFYNDYIAELIMKARKVNNRFQRKSKTGKSFFRFYSFVEGQPIEFYEGFYNIQTSVNGIHDIQFKSGSHRFASLPGNQNAYFATTFLSPILKLISLFGRENQGFNFPDMPFHFTSARKLKQTFSFSFVPPNLNGNGISIIGFESKKDANFYGQLVLDSSLQVMKVSCTKVFLPDERKPIIPKSNGRLVDSLKMTYELFFDQVDGTIVLSHSHIDYSYKFETANRDTLAITTSVLNSNFDYDNNFNLPDYPQQYQDKLQDIMLCELSPFFEDIYAHENIIERTKKETILDRHFERVSSASGKLWFSMLEYEPWQPGFSINIEKLKKTPVVQIRVYMSPGVDGPIMSKYAIELFPFSDYICYDNKPRFTSNVIVDYEQSYCSLPTSDSLLNRHLNNFVDMAKVYSLKSEIELTEAYPDYCPEPEDVRAIEKKHYSAYLLEWKYYLGHTYNFGNNRTADLHFLEDKNYPEMVDKLMELERVSH